MFWGLSPALDLHKELEIVPGSELNILLIGTSDARHIIKTISQSYKYNIQYNFYVAEKWLEQVARQILFLNIILEPENELGLFEKIRIFMELYGNTIIRPPVSKYLYKKSAQLIQTITDIDRYGKRIMPIFNFELLKFKERDYLENIFKFWSRPDSQFEIKKAWDFRVRKLLGNRFDSRHGAFDWDYNMRLREIGADVIFIREYINWRGSGIAFTWLETDGSKPNLTLAAGILGNGLKLHHHGYLGDIQVGPFIGYGIECDDKKMYEKVNHEYKKRSTDIMERNLAQIITEICTNEPYNQENTHIGTEVRCAYMNFPDIKTDLYEDFEPNKYDPETAQPLIKIPNVKIRFVSMSHIPLLHNKTIYKNFFDLMVFSNEQINYLTSDLITMGKNNAKILIETKKFFIEYSKDVIKNSKDIIDAKAHECSLKSVCEYDPLKDAYARFNINH